MAQTLIVDSSLRFSLTVWQKAHMNVRENVCDRWRNALWVMKSQQTFTPSKIIKAFPVSVENGCEIQRASNSLQVGSE